MVRKSPLSSRYGSPLKTRCHVLSLMICIQIAFWEFDDTGAVIKYDAWIPNLELYYPLTNVHRTHQETIKVVCSTVQAECTGKNAQYSSVQNCVNVLSAKPFGSWDEVWMDSVVCRELHLLLARVDPVVRALREPRLM